MSHDKRQTATTIETNHDPRTGEPGAHPVGSGAGAAAGAVTGAFVGSAVGGPVGTLVGAAVGAVAGGLAGHGIAEGINPTREDAYWRENYRTRPYVGVNRSYDDYRPAYQYGWESRARYDDRTWNEVEMDLERGWESYRGNSNLTWNEARNAVRDAWARVTDRVGSEPESRTSLRREDSAGAAATAYGHEDYRSAYWYGWEAAQRYPVRRWEDLANELERGWNQAKGESRLSWREAEPAVREAWKQASSLQGRPKSSPVNSLQQLHDHVTGRLDASRVADYLSVPLKRLSGALGRNYSTVHRTPTASAIQETLRSIERSLVILEEVLGDRTNVLSWLNSSHPDLGRKTPMEVLLEGHAQVIEDMLEASLEGIPS